MRTLFDQELTEFHDRLAGLAQLAADAMRRATASLTGDDVEMARAVVEGDAAVVEQHHELDRYAVELIAAQQPVARDLRILVAGLRMSTDLERMGRLAKHVAEVAVRRHPDGPVFESLRPAFAAMGEVAVRIADTAREAILSGDARLAQRIDRDDDEMDALQTELYRRLIEGTGLDTGTAVDAALLGRYYERFADHAVSLGKRVAFAAGLREAATT